MVREIRCGELFVRDDNFSCSFKHGEQGGFGTVAEFATQVRQHQMADAIAAAIEICVGGIFDGGDFVLFEQLFQLLPPDPQQRSDEADAFGKRAFFGDSVGIVERRIEYENELAHFEFVVRLQFVVVRLLAVDEDAVSTFGVGDVEIVLPDFNFGVYARDVSSQEANLARSAATDPSNSPGRHHPRRVSR